MHLTGTRICHCRTPETAAKAFTAACKAAQSEAHVHAQAAAMGHLHAKTVLYGMQAGKVGPIVSTTSHASIVIHKVEIRISNLSPVHL